MVLQLHTSRNHLETALQQSGLFLLVPSHTQNPQASLERMTGGLSDLEKTNVHKYVIEKQVELERQKHTKTLGGDVMAVIIGPHWIEEPCKPRDPASSRQTITIDPYL